MSFGEISNEVRTHASPRFRCVQRPALTRGDCVEITHAIPTPATHATLKYLRVQHCSVIAAHDYIVMLKHGAWLSATHEENYGRLFKKQSIGCPICWSGSRALYERANALATRNLDVYQFGVYTGGSMHGIARRVRGFGHMWGFDSFTGLPRETEGLRLEGKHWRPGGFSAADALGEWRLSALMANIKKRIGFRNATLIPGYFNESLTAALRSQYPFQPALLVDVDVDLHVSALECLTWMFEQRLVVAGTIVRYDDWRSFGQRHGEGLAHR